MIPARNPDARRASIKAIKTMVGPKGLALDEDTYRAMIGNVVAGKRSLKDRRPRRTHRVAFNRRQRGGAEEPARWSPQSDDLHEIDFDL
ncbi:hypothetical protein GCM10007933_06200 [Zoogloea oryzae]|uniref:Uncharacterized protein n=1 Tax=Zoogloea oryzae TaxID=310767 RepID=A0ABQ6F6K1_9RHOO|nr:hypothetical protein [Zoogloea oryzae]GLT21168.1 hypothetical protein GCM10007933_06200 [Zoogloea oryzae]